MIQIEVFLNECEELVYLRSVGHVSRTLSGRSGMEFNGLCTAVSTLEYQLLYSLQSMLPHLNLKSKIEAGHFELSIDNQKESSKVLHTLTGSFLIGIKMLTHQYQNQVVLHTKVGEKNV